MTAAFVIQVQPELQQDPNEETAALLRVLIYKIDNTTFGNDVPTVPHWSGPPRAIVHVQAILYASLAASLFSAFLAMLGKQWLNRYASISVRGSAIERSQDRQQKLNGIVTWYFDHVMESLPLMLQIALLLLGCALSRYLWGIHTTIASVVLGATSLGLLFYIFVVVAGAAFMSCPYQTPTSRILRWATEIVASVASATSSVFRRALEHSETVEMFRLNMESHQHWWSKNNIIPFLGDILRELLPALAIDIRRLAQTVVRLLVASAHRAVVLLPGVSPTLVRGPVQQTTLLDLLCISWMLHTSLDKGDHLSTLEYLVAVVPPAGFDLTLVVDCLNILVDCARVSSGRAVTAHGPERLETVSSMCLLHTFSHLSSTGPTSTALTDIRLRYHRAFPSDTDYEGYPLHHTLGAIHNALHPNGKHGWLDWGNHKPTDHEHVIIARALARLAQSEYQRRERGEVPRWVLRFALHSLPQDPPPPTSVVVHCLLIVAIDLDCDILGIVTAGSDERYVHARRRLIDLTQN